MDTEKDMSDMTRVTNDTKIDSKMDLSGCDSDCKMDISDSDKSDGILPQSTFKRFKCSFCHKRFVDKRSFTYHVEAHGGKKYYCDICPRRVFCNKMSYDRHLKYHQRGEKYICDICQADFEEKQQLKSHKKKHDVPTLPCLKDPNCEKKFKHKGDQRRHSRFGHRDSKDFPCKVCGKLFQSPQSHTPHEKKCCDYMETDQLSQLHQMSANELNSLLKSRM